MSHTKAVLIIGGSGFIGTHLALRLRDEYKVIATYNKHRVLIPGVTMLPLGLDNKNWIKRIAYTYKPEVVIYAAGKNDPVWAEEHTRVADGLHANGPVTVSGAFDIIQHRFIYLSNSYTFDGNTGNYHETDNPVPITALGKAKISGENFIRGRSLNQVIIRSSPVYGRGNGMNLSSIDRLRIRLARGERVEVANHELQSFAPVYGLTELVARVMATGIRNKVFHYGGLTKSSPYDFARAFARRFKLNEDLIFPAKDQNPLDPEGNPMRADYSLNFTQSIQTFKIPAFGIEDGLDLLATAARE